VQSGKFVQGTLNFVELKNKLLFLSILSWHQLKGIYFFLECYFDPISQNIVGSHKTKHLAQIFLVVWKILLESCNACPKISQSKLSTASS
jgi:hypothetical protein